MIGSFITRGLVMLLGYAYPAYECYKTVEKNKPDVEQLRFWCQYWILVAMLSVFERVGDTFVSWVPMYSEAKLFFFIYLWYPKTKGTAYVYDSFFRPYISQHETDIDRNLLELRTRAEDYAVLYWQKAASYGQTRVFDILQYIASQSTPTPPRSTQSRPTRVRQPPAAQNRQAAVTAQTPIDEPASPASRTSSSEAQKDSVEEKDPADIPESPPPADAMNAQRSTVTQSLAGSSNPMASNVEAVANEGGSLAKEDANPPVQDTVMEESIRVTRARLRQTRATSSR